MKDRYVFEEDMGMFYNPIRNTYLTPKEYELRNKKPCKCCGVMLDIDQICWGKPDAK